MGRQSQMNQNIHHRSQGKSCKCMSARLAWASDCSLIASHGYQAKIVWARGQGVWWWVFLRCDVHARSHGQQEVRAKVANVCPRVARWLLAVASSLHKTVNQALLFLRLERIHTWHGKLIAQSLTTPKDSMSRRCTRNPTPVHSQK